MDSNLGKRYCKNKIRRLRKIVKKNYNTADLYQKDERQFKLDRFVKDIEEFKTHKQSENKNLQNHHTSDTGNENVYNSKAKNRQQKHSTSKEIASKDKVKKKRGLFDYAHMTTSFRRGLLGGPDNARFDQDLRKIIGVDNIKSTVTNSKRESTVSSISNDVTEPLPLFTPPTRIVPTSCNSDTTVKMEEKNIIKSPGFVKKSYPEFARVINQSLALEKHTHFKNENYAKEIKMYLRSIYGQRLMKEECQSARSEKCYTNTLSDLNSPFPPTFLSSYCNKENDDLHQNKLENIQQPQYKSTTEFLKKTLGACSSSQTSSEVVLSPYETFDQDIPKVSRQDCHLVKELCCTEHIKHPVSKLPYPQEYLGLFNSGDMNKSSSVLCLPHPAAKYLDSHLMRSLNFESHNRFGTQKCLEDVDGFGDRVQHFPLPPKEPSPEFQHYPFQLF